MIIVFVQRYRLLMQGIRHAREAKKLEKEPDGRLEYGLAAHHREQAAINFEKVGLLRTAEKQKELAIGLLYSGSWQAAQRGFMSTRAAFRDRGKLLRSCNSMAEFIRKTTTWPAGTGIN